MLVMEKITFAPPTPSCPFSPWTAQSPSAGPVQATRGPAPSECKGGRFLGNRVPLPPRVELASLPEAPPGTPPPSWRTAEPRVHRACQMQASGHLSGPPPLGAVGGILSSRSILKRHPCGLVKPPKIIAVKQLLLLKAFGGVEIQAHIFHDKSKPLCVQSLGRLSSVPQVLPGHRGCPPWACSPARGLPPTPRGQSQGA